jgi:hypothetical protein
MASPDASRIPPKIMEWTAIIIDCDQTALTMTTARLRFG